MSGIVVPNKKVSDSNSPHKVGKKLVKPQTIDSNIDPTIKKQNESK